MPLDANAMGMHAPVIAALRQLMGLVQLAADKSNPLHGGISNPVSGLEGIRGYPGGSEMSRIVAEHGEHLKNWNSGIIPDVPDAIGAYTQGFKDSMGKLPAKTIDPGVQGYYDRGHDDASKAYIAKLRAR